jgi:hypothetical protein
VLSAQVFWMRNYIFKKLITFLSIAEKGRIYFVIINLQNCKSKRIWSKYIIKEDETPYFNCAVNQLSFRIRCLFWAKENKEFRVTHPIVVENDRKWRYLKMLFEEVHGKQIKESRWYRKFERGYGGWRGRVALWYNNIVSRGFWLCRVRQL